MALRFRFAYGKAVPVRVGALARLHTTTESLQLYTAVNIHRLEEPERFRVITH